MTPPVSAFSTRSSADATVVDAAQDRPILEVRDLETYLFTKRGVGKAVDGVSFSLRRGETLGLVGESGSGKSLTALSIVGLNPKPASRVVGGHVFFRGEDLLGKTEREIRKYRGRHIAMILQDPLTALNPALSIRSQLYEALRLHKGLSGAELRSRAKGILETLRISDPDERLKSFPHQLSGGMRQRVVAAIALSCGPEVLIADEPTTSLDVTVQAAFLRLLEDIQKATGVAILFITHDLGVVARLCHRVAVMYAGKIVETGETRTVFGSPSHPYTEALLKSLPTVDAPPRRLPAIAGHPPSIYNLGGGCPFVPRCSYARAECRDDYPPTVEVGVDHLVRCWRHV
jgi:oligopeptide/dipeptide ABC transporter ATP-binding protein